MARTARLIVPNQPHHIIQRGNNRQQIFRDDDDFRKFSGWLLDAARLFKVAVHAYVLMDNHIHLLASPSDEIGLARMMQWIGRHYVLYFNRKHGRTGTLWEGRYKTSVIDSDNYFLACCRYIEMNPVRAGLTADPAAYPWSSYAHHAGVKPDPLINDHPLYWALGNTPFAREAVFKALAAQALTTEEIEFMDRALLKGKPLGSDEFQIVLEKRTNCRVRPGKRGRPVKNAPEANLIHEAAG
jgi:putative transposase